MKPLTALFLTILLLPAAAGAAADTNEIATGASATGTSIVTQDNAKDLTDQFLALAAKVSRLVSDELKVFAQLSRHGAEITNLKQLAAAQQTQIAGDNADLKLLLSKFTQREAAITALEQLVAGQHEDIASLFDTTRDLTDRFFALAAVVHAFASEIPLDGHAVESSLEISAAPQSLRRVEGSRAFAEIEAARESWGHQIPGTPDGFWKWCLDQDQSVLLDLLAFCTAPTVNAVQVKSDRQDSGRFRHAAMLASALSLDMKAWFTPTADNYFRRISKPHILAAMLEAKGTPPAPAWEKLKKAELAAVAERETSGTGWLPLLLR